MRDLQFTTPHIITELQKMQENIAGAKMRGRESGSDACGVLWFVGECVR